MVWKIDAPQGFESDKIRYEVLPYLCKGGLDVGCGPKKVWSHLIGVDSGIDTQLFGIPMRPDIVCNDATELSLFANESVPAVFSSHTLEHLQEWGKALKEWWRLIKPNGHLVLYLPHRDLYPRIGEPGANPDHKHDFEPNDIIDYCRLAFPDWKLVQNQIRGEGFEYSFLLVFQKGEAGTGQSEPWKDISIRKTAGIVRLGGNGDALWAASVAANLHEQGFDVTMYVGANGEQVLRHDPHIKRLVQLPQGVLNDEELLEFYAHEAVKFSKWVNLIGSVESRLLPHQSEQAFYLPHELRHKLMNVNYLDMVHDYAEIPRQPVRQRFYPSKVENEVATKFRAELPGKLVVVSPTGSGMFKAWPHAQKFMRLMAERKVYTVMVGDLKHLPELEPVEFEGTTYGHIVGTEWPLRIAMSYALLADAVVATESVFLNAVAYEKMPKVALLSHSSHENLTRGWPNTAVIEANVPCHPCHRIHNASATMCSKDTNTKAAACMASYSAEVVADIVFRALGMEASKVIPIKPVKPAVAEAA